MTQLPLFPTGSDPRALSAEAFVSHCDPRDDVHAVDTEAWVVCAIPRAGFSSMELKSLLEALLSDVRELEVGVIRSEFDDATDAIDPRIMRPLRRTAGVLHRWVEKEYESRDDSEEIEEGKVESRNHDSKKH